MPRKGPPPRRDLMPDPIYRSVLVTQFVNKVLSRGKRSLAERIVYSALEVVKEKSGGDPVAALKRAMENVKPQLEVKSRRVGGATYQVPVEVRPRRATTLGIRWLVGYARQRREKTMAAAPRQRNTRRLQRCWKQCQAPRRHAQDGRVEQGVRPLPLVEPRGLPPSLPITSRTAGAGVTGRLQRSSGRRSHATHATSPTHITRKSSVWLKHRSFESSRWPGPATSGSWPTSTRARPPRPSASSITPARRTRSVRSTRVPPSWTGWCRSRSGASPSPPRPPPAGGRTTGSTSSTRPATSTSRSRSSGRCACSTGPSPSSTRWPGSSPRPRPSGTRPTSTRSPASASSTRWTASAPTSSAPSTRSSTASTPRSPWCRSRSAPRATSGAWSTCWA